MNPQKLLLAPIYVNSQRR